MTNVLIGLHGRKYAGKDSAAIGLTTKHGFERVALAGPLKRMVEVYLTSTVGVQETARAMLSKFFEEQGLSTFTRMQLMSPENLHTPTTYLNNRTVWYTLNELEAWGVVHVGGAFWRGEDFGPGISPEKLPCYIEGALKETPLTVCNGKSARHMMQTLGTEWGRQRLGQNIWVDVALRRCSTLRRAVVTDVRFDNEAQAIRNNGGYVIEIIREGQPSGADAHASEMGVSPDLIDARVYNNSSIEELQSRLIRQVDRLMLSPAL